MVADGGDLVHEGNSGGKEGIAGVLDHLGRGDVGDYHRSAYSVVQAAYGSQGPGVARGCPDDYTVWAVPVGQRLPCPEKLRIGGIADAGAGQVMLEDSLAGAGRHRALHGHHQVSAASFPDPANGGVHLAQFWNISLTRRRSDRDEGHLTQVLFHLVAVPEADVATLARGLEAVRQARLVSSVPSGTKGPHFKRIYVCGQDIVARKGQAGSRDGPDGAKSNYRYFQTVNLLAMEWWPGDRHCGNADLGNSEGLRESWSAPAAEGIPSIPGSAISSNVFEVFQRRPAVVAESPDPGRRRQCRRKIANIKPQCHKSYRTLRQ